MPPADSSPATLAYLHVHGISVSSDELGFMVREAVERLPTTLVPTQPGTGLSAHEVEALERGGFDLSPEEGNRVLAETAAELAALLQTGLSTREAAQRLSVDPSRIRQRVGSRPRSLYGVRVGRGWRLPLFQFEGDGLVPGIDRVIAVLDCELDPVSMHRWFQTVCPDLIPRNQSSPLSPLDWLRLRLPVDKVIAIAAAL